MKKYFAGIVIIQLLLAGCTDLVSKEGSVTDNSDNTKQDSSVIGDNSIDAVSSATGKLKLNNGKVFTDSLVINCWYKYSNGTTWALIIDNNADTVIIDTVNRSPLSYPSRVDWEHTLKPLSPSKEYRLIIQGHWISDSWRLDTIKFTTGSVL